MTTKTETKPPETVRVSVTDATIVRHLLPGARVYDYVVTQDDFDEYDNEAAGHYAGVEVSADVGERWDLGLQRCDERGFHPRSRDGIQIRYHAQHGDDARIPGDLHAWLARRARVEADRAERVAIEAAALAEYESLKDGYTCVGADKYSGQWWGQASRRDLPVLGFHRRGSEIPGPGGKGFWRELRKLPCGDLVEYNGQAWSRWTTDPDVISNHAMRSSITAHRYDRDLLAALVELERAGALRVSCASWFGGTPPRDLSAPVPCYGGSHSSTGPETIERLRKWLTDAAERHPGHRTAIESALTLVTDQSIQHEL